MILVAIPSGHDRLKSVEAVVVRFSYRRADDYFPVDPILFCMEEAPREATLPRSFYAFTSEVSLISIGILLMLFR